MADPVVPQSHTFTVSESQRNTVLNALHERLVDAKRYTINSKISESPGPEDECCAIHLARFERRRDEHRALADHEQEIRRTITIFEAPDA